MLADKNSGVNSFGKIIGYYLDKQAGPLLYTYPRLGTLVLVSAGH